MDYVHYENGTKKSKEYKVPFQNQDVLVLLRCNYFLVPGVVVYEKYKTNPDGLKVSEVEPVLSFQKQGIEAAVLKHFEPIIDDLSKKTCMTSEKIEQVIFW